MEIYRLGGALKVRSAKSAALSENHGNVREKRIKLKEKMGKEVGKSLALPSFSAWRLSDDSSVALGARPICIEFAAYSINKGRHGQSFTSMCCMPL